MIAAESDPFSTEELRRIGAITKVSRMIDTCAWSCDASSSCYAHHALSNHEFTPPTF